MMRMGRHHDPSKPTCAGKILTALHDFQLYPLGIAVKHIEMVDRMQRHLVWQRGARQFDFARLLRLTVNEEGGACGASGLVTCNNP